MNKTFQDLLTAARTVNNPPAALSAAIEAADKHLSIRGGLDLGGLRGDTAGQGER